MNVQDAHQFIPLVQALAEGKQLQFFNRQYNVWKDIYEVSFCSPPETYRIKPEILKYRRALYNGGSTPSGHDIVIWYEHEGTLEAIQQTVNFVRWIDTEWQEVEL